MRVVFRHENCWITLCFSPVGVDTGSKIRRVLRYAFLCPSVSPHRSSLTVPLTPLHKAELGLHHPVDDQTSAPRLALAAKSLERSFEGDEATRGNLAGADARSQHSEMRVLQESIGVIYDGCSCFLV